MRNRGRIVRRKYSISNNIIPPIQIEINDDLNNLVDNCPVREGGNLKRPAPGSSQLRMRRRSGLVDLPGALELETLQELQTPCLTTTHIIRPKTANFTGISNVIQSIITFSFYLQFQVIQ